MKKRASGIERFFVAASVRLHRASRWHPKLNCRPLLQDRILIGPQLDSQVKDRRNILQHNGLHLATGQLIVESQKTSDLIFTPVDIDSEYMYTIHRRTRPSGRRSAQLPCGHPNVGGGPIFHTP